MSVQVISVECLYDALTHEEIRKTGAASVSITLDTVRESPRRRSENRQRTQQVKLRLLPQEEERLRRHAELNGFPTVQAYILHRLPEITGS